MNIKTDGIYRTVTDKRIDRRVCAIVQATDETVTVQWAGVARFSTYDVADFLSRVVEVPGAAIQTGKNRKNDGTNYRITIDGGQTGPVRFSYADTLLSLQTSVQGEGIAWDPRWA